MTWGAVMVINDLGHSLMEPFDIGLYLIAYAPLYVFVPLITLTVLGRLSARPEPGSGLRTPA